MLERGSGSIINVASVAGSIKGRAEPLRLRQHQGGGDRPDQGGGGDFITRGIRCNAICPGTVESPSCAIASRRAGQGERPDDGAGRGRVHRPPADGATGRVEEIAALAVYLASDESSFTTGTAQIIDGGWSN